MMEYIREIISRFGGRYAGSEQEKKAQIYTKEILEKYCDSTELMAFESPLEAHFQSLKLFSVVYILSLIIFKFNITVAAVLSIVNTIFFLGHFVTYRHWLDFLYKNKTSHNVIGDIEPTHEPISTIIISGHIDSVKEFKWWYKLKKTGVMLSIFAGFLFPLLSIFMVIIVFTTALWTPYVWMFFLITSPVLIVYFNMHGKEVVDGASDNLTGVAIALEMAKIFSKTRLKHTRVRCISFGAEELGLRGSWAYAKSNKQQLIDEKALLINVDTIKDVNHFIIATSETNPLVSYDEADIHKMEQSFNALNMPVKKTPFVIGASDAVSFRRLGLPALSLLGMNVDDYDPCYHTRLDNLDHLDGKAMEEITKVLTHFITEWDYVASRSVK